MLNALKRRIARSMARRGYVQHLVKEGLHTDPEFLNHLRHRLREELLHSHEFQNAALDILRAEPHRMEELIRNPDFFKAVLSRYARNPEALHQLLQRAPLRNNLKAQGDFLRSIARSPELSQEILAQLPSHHRSEAIHVLLQQDADLLGKLSVDGPMALAALLTQIRFAKPGDVAGSEHTALQGFSHFLGTHRAAFIAALAESDPQLAQALMNDATTAEQIMQVIAADRQALAQIIELAVVQPSHGDTVAERLRVVLDLLTSLPAFRAALNRDPELRNKLAALLRDGLESLGQPFENDRVSA